MLRSGLSYQKGGRARSTSLLPKAIAIVGQGGSLGKISLICDNFDPWDE